MNIKTLIDSYVDNGYEFEDAQAKVGQDIVLIKISNSKFSNHITIKGGVVMHSISDDMRRATRDLDLDFIKYSLDDVSIRNFIKTLSDVDNEIKIEVNGNIKSLHHQDYDGKRAFIKISDNYNNVIETKLDIGVHKQFDIEQDKYCFNLEIINKSANLLINSKEQIFAEKLKSLLKLGRRSTRYKDLFDFYYLITIEKLDKDKLLNCLNVLIFTDDAMREKNIADIVKRFKRILNSQIYRNNLTDPKVNWLDLPIEQVIEEVLSYLEELDNVIVG